LLDEQLAFLEKSLHVSYQQLVEMATSTPSAVLGLRSGLLAAGRAADIAIFDSQHRCRLVMIDGNVLYSS
jgi:N-acetylglucosamine-6-phosphate deacetylase